MIDIFIAYSHNDLRYKDELKKFLRPLLNTSQARVWDDYDIEAGKDWEAEIKTRLYGADIILLLVSPDSLASEYFYGREVAVSLERHEKGEAVVAPVILRPCAWTITPLKKIEAMPEKGKPITSWASQDEAFTDVAHRIGEIVARLQAEHDAKGEQAEVRRRFDASVAAAEQLFRKENWAEAGKAFKEALNLYKPGFVPDAATLQNQITACAGSIQENDDLQAFEAQKAEFEKKLALADDFFAQQNWAEALPAYRETLALYDPAFPPSEATGRIKERIAACEAALKPPVIVKPPKEKTVHVEATVRKSAPSDNNRFLLWGGIGLAVVALLLFLIFGRERNRNEKPQTPGNEQPTLRPIAHPSAADQAFQNAKTIPALQDFLQKYPNDKNAAEAKRLLDGLDKNRTAWLVTATLNLEDADFANARKYYERVLTIDPGNRQARQGLDKIKGR